MKRTLTIALITALVLALLLACSPSRLFGGSISDYVGKMRAPLQEFAGWSQDMLTFANDALRERNAETICRDDVLADLVSRGQGISDQMSSIEPPAALEAPHDAVANGAAGVVASLARANDLICKQNDLAGGLESLQEAIGPLEDLLGKLQELQKLLPSS